MADFLSFNLKGDAFAALDKLAEVVDEGTLRAVGYAGAKVFQDEAILRVPVKEGIVKRNIIVKRAEERSAGKQRQTYLVLVRKGKLNKEGDAYYAGFLESGHKIVRRKPKGKTWKAHRKAEQLEFGNSRVAARPFIRPAFGSKKAAALEAMRLKLSEKLAEKGL